jgi:Mg-chelatase subunit ChlD
MDDENRTVRSDDKETVRSDDKKKDASLEESRSLAASIEAKIGAMEAPSDASTRADVVFVLDCTGSMRREIDTVRSALDEFAEEIEQRGVPLRIGLVGFRDLFEGEEPEVFDLSDDISSFQKSLRELRATGGGDEPESALDALMTALDQPFEAEHQKVTVLITDAPPHIPDKHTDSIEQVKDRMRKVGLDQLYLVYPTDLDSCAVYDELEPNGPIFDLGRGDDFEGQTEHFKEVLLNLGKSIATTTLSAGTETLGWGRT